MYILVLHWEKRKLMSPINLHCINFKMSNLECIEDEKFDKLDLVFQ